LLDVFIRIYGFQNIDKISCYTNAMLQCLLHLHVIWKQLFLNYNKLDVLNLFTHQYEHGINNLNTYEIWQSLEEYFSFAIKRDALEFLTALCIKYDYIQILIDQQITLICRCNSCDDILYKNNILLPIFINLEKKSFNLNDLIIIIY